MPTTPGCGPRRPSSWPRSGVGKAVLGICLGAQLIADVLGGPVTKNGQHEIGWYPVDLTEAGRAEPLFAGFPARFTALHWHGDTFAIPPGATHVAGSAACANQAFSLDGGRVAGLQFHLEETPVSLEVLVEHAAAELEAADTEPWVASKEELLAADAPYEQCRALLFKLLDRMAARLALRPTRERRSAGRPGSDTPRPYSALSY